VGVVSESTRLAAILSSLSTTAIVAAAGFWRKGTAFRNHGFRGEDNRSKNDYDHYETLKIHRTSLNRKVT
jgi:hypothetical protein